MGGSAPSWGRPDPRLTDTVRALPRVGIHRWPVTCWPAPTLHPAGNPVVIAEEHGGFAFGGNKVRQVDVLLGQAREAGADTVVTSAGPHSNLCRVVAAAARAAGLDVHLVLRGEPPAEPSRNQVLYELAGARLHWVRTTDAFDPVQAETMTAIADEARANGSTTAVVDVRTAPGSTLCAVATTAVVDELADTLADRPPDRIMLAGGAGNTAGGVLAALAARRATVGLVVASALAPAAQLRALVRDRAAAALDRAGLPAALLDEVSLEVTDGQLGGGHGVPTEAAVAAQRATARASGAFLDLTYNSKAMAALLADDRPGSWLFLHTGGSPNVFAPHPFPSDVPHTDEGAPR
ncbi:pyridoxal-phosphate dependent enzyme [Micromonospora sp. NPDC003241]